MSNTKPVKNVNAADGATSIGLPVLDASTGRRAPRSRMGRWRALTLLGVHVLMVIHIIHWKVTGSSISPIEPSESIEFSKNGVVNAGLISMEVAVYHSSNPEEFERSITIV